MDELACFVPGMLALGASGYSPRKAEQIMNLAKEVVFYFLVLCILSCLCKKLCSCCFCFGITYFSQVAIVIVNIKLHISPSTAIYLYTSLPWWLVYIHIVILLLVAFWY
jgi:hypothetical protein